MTAPDAAALGDPEASTGDGATDGEREPVDEGSVVASGGPTGELGGLAVSTAVAHPPNPTARDRSAAPTRQDRRYAVARRLR